MSSSTLAQNTRTTRVPQNILSSRGNIPIKHSRNHHTSMNGDHHYDRDFCSNDNVTTAGLLMRVLLTTTHAQPEESHPFQKTNVSQGTKPCTSHPVPGGVVDVEDLAAIDYHGTPRHENNRSSTQSNTTITTASSTRRSRNSQILTPSSPDPTRSRHVPRGPVPRVHPSTSHAIKSSMSQGHQKSLGHSKPIMGGVQTGSEIGLVGTAGVGTDTMRASYAPSPLQNIKSKLDHSTMRSPRDNKPPQNSAPVRRPPSPHRNSNPPPISSNDDVRPCLSLGLGSLEFEVSATAGCSKPEQGNRDSNKAVEMKVRPTVRPLPALPGESSGSASKSGTEPVEELYPPSSLTTFSNSLTPPHKMDAAELHSTNKFGMASRAATITSRKLATFNTQTTQLRCTPQRTMTNDRDQSDDDTPTPTVPFPTPRRSMTIGVPSLSRDAKPPPLSIPPLNRCLSLKGFTEGTARLSPSVIIRPPPLPLVNLPVLVVSSATGSEVCEKGDARRRSRLMMSMPALPLQGSGRATRGHEEVDDLEDDDDEEDEVDEVNEPASGQSSASSSSRIETPRSSFDSETSLEEAGGDDFTEKQSTLNHSSQTLSSTSSYETARAEPSPSFWESHRWDVDQLPPAKPGSKATSSSSKVPRHLPQVDLNAGGIDYDSSTDHIRVEKGKAKQELRGKEGLIGDFVFPLTKEAALSNSKCRGDRGVDGLKVVATPDDVKVARSYGSERLVLERVGSGGSSGRARLNSNDPNPSGAKNGTLARHPLPLEPLRAAGSSTLPVKGTILGSPHPGDRAMRSNSRLLSISTTPLGSPQLEEPRTLGIGPHNDMYRRASRSLIDVHAIEMKERVERMVRDQEEEDERKRSSRILKVGRKGNEGVVSQDKGKQSEAEECSVWHFETLNPENGTPTSVERTTVVEKTDNTQESASHPLRRRRSVPTTGPPSYSALFTGLPPGLAMDLKVLPREDEGKENLPPYTNDIFLKAVMPRKMEFTSPGVQAKDRKWRQVLCVLDGTALRVYKCPPRTGGVSAWWDSKIGVGDPLTDSAASPSGARGTVRNSAASGGDMRRPGGALARETELARAKKNGDPHLQINTPADRSQHLRSYSPLPKPQGQIHQERQSSVSQGVTKSALTFAVQLLKPGATRHSRSSSEVSHVSGPLPSSSRSRRASSSSPRESTSGRMTPTTQAENDRSGSVLSHWSSQSRPLTPASGERSDSKKRGGENDLIRAYTMQHAESGLGKDYTKRQHVIRVRLEGEQFLLQAKDVDGVIAWIEVIINMNLADGF